LHLRLGREGKAMSILDQVITGKVKKPYYVLLYGEPGIGKSTFAASAPNPIFLCSEDGANEIGVARITLNTLKEFKDAIEELIKTEHNYKTIVIDTVDHLEQRIFTEVCNDKKKKSIEDIGYAKGYIYALDYWTELIDLLEKARNEKKMNIILLAHSVVKAHNDPQLDAPYDTYQIKLHNKASEFIRDRVSTVLFATYKTYLHEKESGKNKAYGDGSRVMFTEKRPAFVAKNRDSLPFELPLNWDEYVNAASKQVSKDIPTMITFIENNISSLDAAVRDKAKEHFEKNRNNPVVLAQIEDRIKTIISTKTA
jgi:predicted kinase